MLCSLTTLVQLLLLYYQHCVSLNLPIFNRWALVTIWLDLSCRYRAITDFFAFIMLLLILAISLYLTSMACFTYDSKANRICLGYCLTTRYPIASTTLQPSTSLSLRSQVRATRLPISSTCYACLLILVIFSRVYYPLLSIALNPICESVAISIVLRSASESVETRFSITIPTINRVALAVIMCLLSDNALVFYVYCSLYTTPTLKLTFWLVLANSVS